MKHRKHILSVFIFGILISCISCKKFVEIPPPKNQLVNEAIFSDSSNATKAVLGLYVNMIQSASLNIASGGTTVYTALSADEIYPTASSGDPREFYDNAISVNNAQNGSSLWQNGYSIIYGANACIEGLTLSNTLFESVKNQLLGESRFVRAFIYFNLVNLYGPIPLITSTDYNQNKIEGRSPVDAIYDQIILDLREAKKLLTTNYVSAERARPNKYTASALLAKVYLYQKRWNEAENEASQIINSNTYSLESDLNNVYKASNIESIWKLRPVYTGVETWEGYFILPASSTVLPNYVVTNYLLNAFELNDQRKVKWLKSNIVSGQAYYYPNKYKLGYDGATTPLEHYIVFRLAEQYLIRAEARVQQGNLTDAITDVNLIRSRAGLTNLISSLTQAQIISAVEQERRIELFCEWGNRWFDLKRTDRVNAVLGLIKTNWQPTDILYPIPQLELNRNPFLTQNPGY